MESTRVRSVWLRSVVILNTEVRPLDQYDRGRQWSSYCRRQCIVTSGVEAVEVGAVEKVEAFADQLQREILFHSNIARHAHVQPVICIAVIAIAFDVRGQVTVTAAALPTESAKAVVLRAVNRERNIGYGDDSREGTATLRRIDAAQPVTAQQHSGSTVRQLTAWQIPYAVDDKAVSLVGRRRCAVEFEIELIGHITANKRAFRACAAAIGSARKILCLRQCVGDVELESLSKTTFYFDEQGAVPRPADCANDVNRAEIRVRAR